MLARRARDEDEPTSDDSAVKPAPGKSSRTHGGGSHRGLPGKMSLTMRLAQTLARSGLDAGHDVLAARTTAEQQHTPVAAPPSRGAGDRLQRDQDVFAAFSTFTGPTSAAPAGDSSEATTRTSNALDRAFAERRAALDAHGTQLTGSLAAQSERRHADIQQRGARFASQATGQVRDVRVHSTADSRAAQQAAQRDSQAAASELMGAESDEARPPTVDSAPPESTAIEQETAATPSSAEQADRDMAPTSSRDVSLEVDRDMAPTSSRDVPQEVDRDMAPTSSRDVPQEVDRDMAPTSSRDVSLDVDRDIAHLDQDASLAEPASAAELSRNEPAIDTTAAADSARSSDAESAEAPGDQARDPLAESRSIDQAASPSRDAGPESHASQPQAPAPLPRTPADEAIAAAEAAPPVTDHIEGQPHGDQTGEQNSDDPGDAVALPEIEAPEIAFSPADQIPGAPDESEAAGARFQAEVVTTVERIVELERALDRNNADIERQSRELAEQNEALAGLTECLEAISDPEEEITEAHRSMIEDYEGVEPMHEAVDEGSEEIEDEREDLDLLEQDRADMQDELHMLRASSSGRGSGGGHAQIEAAATQQALDVLQAESAAASASIATEATLAEQAVHDEACARQNALEQARTLAAADMDASMAEEQNAADQQIDQSASEAENAATSASASRQAELSAHMDTTEAAVDACNEQASGEATLAIADERDAVASQASAAMADIAAQLQAAVATVIKIMSSAVAKVLEAGARAAEDAIRRAEQAADKIIDAAEDKARSVESSADDADADDARSKAEDIRNKAQTEAGNIRRAGERTAQNKLASARATAQSLITQAKLRIATMQAQAQARSDQVQGQKEALWAGFEILSADIVAQQIAWQQQIRAELAQWKASSEAALQRSLDETIEEIQDLKRYTREARRRELEEQRNQATTSNNVAVDTSQDANAGDQNAATTAVQDSASNAQAALDAQSADIEQLIAANQPVIPEMINGSNFFPLIYLSEENLMKTLVQMRDSGVNDIRIVLERETSTDAALLAPGTEAATDPDWTVNRVHHVLGKMDEVWGQGDYGDVNLHLALADGVAGERFDTGPAFWEEGGAAQRSEYLQWVDEVTGGVDNKEGSIGLAGMASQWQGSGQHRAHLGIIEMLNESRTNEGVESYERDKQYVDLMRTAGEMTLRNFSEENLDVLLSTGDAGPWHHAGYNLDGRGGSYQYMSDLYGKDAEGKSSPFNMISSHPYYEQYSEDKYTPSVDALTAYSQNSGIPMYAGEVGLPKRDTMSPEERPGVWNEMLDHWQGIGTHKGYMTWEFFPDSNYGDELFEYAIDGEYKYPQGGEDDAYWQAVRARLQGVK